MTELARYREAVGFVIAELRKLGLDYAHFTGRVEERVERILNPLPELEEAEAEVWASIDISNGMIWGVGTKEEMEIATDTSNPRNLIKIVKLTGSYQRPVPRPVERSAKVRFHSSPASTFCYMDGDAMPNSEFIADITWTETPKGE